MKTRMSYAKSSPGLYEAMGNLDQFVQKSGLESNLVLFVQLRASQINGCAYCLDMHSRDLRAAGEREQRLYALDAWRESPWYSDRERAALEWTEAVTLVAGSRVPDAVYDEVRPHFSEKELACLTLAVAAINAWNRLSIAARLAPSSNEPATVPT